MDPKTPYGGPDLSGLRIDERVRTSVMGRKTKRLIAWSAVAVIIVVGAFFGLRGRTAVVTLAEARPGGDPAAATLLNASGYITPRRRATVAAKITARVVDVFVDEGMAVAEGQLLARLDDSDAQRRLQAARTQRDATAAAIASLRVNLANAERELIRNASLAADGYASAQALDQARTASESLKAQVAAAEEQVKAADAQIALARQDVENCIVRAPFGGIVVSKDAQKGEMVSPISAGGGFTRTGIATIVDMESIEIEVDVNESYIARVVPGQRVEAVIDAYPDWRIPAAVRTIIPTADRQKATVKVRISFDKLDPRILPDMGVKVSFLAGEQAGARPAARAVVPREAARTVDGRTVVFVDRGGVLERRAVSLGLELGADVEVTAGLSPGDKVVVEGPADLRDGQRIRVK
ncbi:MAG: efflux RND transporter periplasmic adaptor subunit [Candidatus Aminicenantes bacterium]|nr:MAG: efflux RND transporter periplasmic adaptor subunit [Candidatus Aminicenantes bacterium]